jgi:hypothetical protein
VRSIALSFSLSGTRPDGATFCLSGGGSWATKPKREPCAERFTTWVIDRPRRSVAPGTTYTPWLLRDRRWCGSACPFEPCAVPTNGRQGGWCRSAELGSRCGGTRWMSLTSSESRPQPWTARSAHGRADFAYHAHTIVTVPFAERSTITARRNHPMQGKLRPGGYWRSYSSPSRCSRCALAWRGLRCN